MWKASCFSLPGGVCGKGPEALLHFERTHANEMQIGDCGGAWGGVGP